MGKKILILFCVIFFALTGCSSKDNANGPSGYDWLPSTKNKNEILLYDKYDQRIVAYNKKNYNVTDKNTTQNYMQFEFNDLNSDVYTTGHSIENGYKILKKENDKLSILYKMKENEAIFPLAYKDEQTMYFLKTSYDSNGNEIYNDRIICEFELKSKKLKELKITKGYLTSYAVVIGDFLYFTVYNEKNNDYNLYKINMNKKDKILLINTGLITEEIYNNNGRLLVSNKDKIYDYKDNKIHFSKKKLNYFYLNYLFQIDINNEGDLQLTVTDIKTNKILKVLDKIIDIRVENDKIYIYTLEKIIVI